MWNAECSDDWCQKREFLFEKNVPYMHFRFTQWQRRRSEFLSILYQHTCSSGCPWAASGKPSNNGQVAREGKRVKCELLACRLWRLFEVGSYFNVDGKLHHAKAFGFGTTNWGLRGDCHLKNLLEIYEHL